jgi:hypothetical protein
MLNTRVAILCKDGNGFHSYDDNGNLLVSSQHAVIACGASGSVLMTLFLLKISYKLPAIFYS